MHFRGVLPPSSADRSWCGPPASADAFARSEWRRGFAAHQVAILLGSNTAREGHLHRLLFKERVAERIVTGRDAGCRLWLSDPSDAAGATVISTSFFSSSFLLFDSTTAPSNGRKRFRVRRKSEQSVCAISLVLIVSNRLGVDLQSVFGFNLHIAKKGNDRILRIVDRFVRGNLIRLVATGG